MVSKASVAHFTGLQPMCMSTGFEQSCYTILSQVSAQEQVLVTQMQQVPFLLLIQPMGATIQA